MSACTASSAAACARRWSARTCKRRSASKAPPLFLRKLGELTGLDPEPFIAREKHTTIKPLWDLWRSRHAGLLRHRQLCASSRPRPTRGASGTSSKTDLGLPCTFAFSRSAGIKPDNAAVKEAIRTKPPLVLFGSYNERMYLAELNGRSIYVPASFPGAVIRRHTGTPFMGYAGATYLVQEVCNALFDALFNMIPLSTQMDAAEPTLSRTHAELPWDAAAKQALDAAIEAEPVLVRISTAKRLRDAAERAARRAGEPTLPPRASMRRGIPFAARGRMSARAHTNLRGDCACEDMPKTRASWAKIGRTPRRPSR